jgi:hypothetical protein
MIMLPVTQWLGIASDRPEYLHMLDDMARMLCIQLTIQVLLYFSGDTDRSFFTREFLLLVMYVELGVMLYWLIVRRLVGFA